MADTAEASVDTRKTRIHEIWMIGLAELHAKTGTLDFWKYYGELHELRRRPLETTWLEATIAMAAIGRIRPAKAMGYLKKLRERREKLDDMQAYHGFKDLVDTYLSPARMTNHGFDRTTFADLDHGSVWEHVRAHLSVLSDEGYQVFLNSGTLLGVVRDKKLIDHDDDVDLGLILHAQNTEDAIREWSELRQKLEKLDLFDTENFRDDPIYKLKPIGRTQIDLFPAWQEDGRFFVYPHTHGNLAVEDVLPLRVCELTGHALPAKPERMLEVNYGEGWRHPDPLFKFPWASANREFAPFLEGLGQ